MVPLEGLEPPTRDLGRRRSIQAELQGHGSGQRGPYQNFRADGFIVTGCTRYMPLKPQEIQGCTFALFVGALCITIGVGTKMRSMDTAPLVASILCTHPRLQNPTTAMKNTHALILAPFDEGQLKRLTVEMRVTYESWLNTLKLTDPDDLAARIVSERISILVMEADFLFADTFADAPGLELVGVCRASTAQVDVEAATAHGVVVVNTPHRNAHAVAEHALGLIFSLARRIPTAHHYVASGQWRHPVGGYVDMRGIELAGRTLGIIGMGAIGRRLAEMGQALGMSTLGCDPYINDPPEGVDMVDLRTVASRSDFISIHVPTKPQTIGMIDTQVLACMRPTAFLVNCSDAGVIDQTALVQALTTGRVAGAAFDVFETHPIAPDNPLLQLDNVILTPHVGGATAETIQRHSKMMTDDILRFMGGDRPVNLVNPEVWDRHAR